MNPDSQPHPQLTIAVSLTSMGLIGQVLGFGIVFPFFYALCLGSAADFDFRVDLNAANTVPVSVLLGIGIPSILVALPAPSLISVDRKIQFILVWLLFPLLTYVLRVSLTSVVSRQRAKKPVYGVPHYVYAFALASSALPWVSFWTLELTAIVAPQVFQPHVAAALSPSHILRLVNPLMLSAKLSSLSDGVLGFIQWDFALVSVACLIWALGSTIEDTRFSRNVETVVIAALSALALGPASAAIILIWRRDASKFARLQDQKKSIKSQK